MGMILVFGMILRDIVIVIREVKSQLSIVGLMQQGVTEKSSGMLRICHCSYYFIDSHRHCTLLLCHLFHYEKVKKTCYSRFIN